MNPPASPGNHSSTDADSGDAGRAAVLVLAALRHPTYVVTVAAFLAVYALTLLPSLNSDYGLEQLLIIGRSSSNRYRSLQHRLGRDDGVINVYLTDSELMSPAGLRRLLELTSDLADSGLVASVTSLATTPLMRLQHEEALAPPGFREDNLDRLDYDALEDSLLAEPLYAQLLSADAQTTTIRVQMQPYVRHPSHIQAFLGHITRTLTAHGDDESELHALGVPLAYQAYRKQLQRDTLNFAPILAITMGLALSVTLRSRVAVLVSLTCVALAELLTFGIMALLGFALNPMSAVVAVIVALATTSSMVLFIGDYTRELAQHGDREDALEATAESSTEILMPTALLITLALMAPLATGIPMLRDFGFAAAIGVTISFLTAIVLGPAMLSLLPPPRRHVAIGLWRGLARAVVTQPFVILLLGAGITAVLATVGYTRLRIETRVVHELGPQRPLRAVRNTIPERIGGDTRLNLLLYAPIEAETALTPDFVSAVRMFQRELEDGEDDVVASTISLGDLLAVRARNCNDETLSLSSELLSDVIAGLDREALQRWVMADQRALRVAVQMRDIGTHSYAGFVRRAEALAARTAGARLEVHGLVNTTHRSGRRLMSSAAWGFLTSVAVVSIAAFLALLSVRLTAIAVVPVVAVAALAFGLIGIIGVELSVSSCAIFPIALCFAVQSSFPLVWSYRGARGTHGSAYDAIVRVMRRTGPSTLTSAFVGIGFAALVFARFGPVRTAAVAAICAPAAAAVTLLLVPALMIVATWVSRRGTGQPPPVP